TTVLPFFFAELSLAGPLPVSSGGALGITITSSENALEHFIPNSGNLLERLTQDVLTIIENKSKDNIQGYVSVAAVNYNQGELKAITTRSGLVLDGPFVPMAHPFINSEEDERADETLTGSELVEYTIKVPPPLVQKAKPPSLRNYVVHQRDPHHPHIPYPSRMNQEE
nr:hypothetical protein [Tanacetum cinerariifolium]